MFRTWLSITRYCLQSSHRNINGVFMNTSCDSGGEVLDVNRSKNMQEVTHKKKTVPERKLRSATHPNKTDGKL